MTASPGCRTRRRSTGAFPSTRCYCDPAVWQAAVTALADRADVVVMDLRGMGAGNRGALFELKMAVQRVELSRIVLLADTRTDERALAEAAEEAWRARPGVSSPDRRRPAARGPALHRPGRARQSLDYREGLRGV